MKVVVIISCVAFQKAKRKYIHEVKKKILDASDAFDLENKKAIEECKKKYPKSQGWSGHKVIVMLLGEVVNSKVELLVDD